MRDQNLDKCWLITLKGILISELRECVAAKRIRRAQRRNYFVDDFKSDKMCSVILSNVLACWRNIYAFPAVITGYYSLNRIYISVDNKLLILLFSYTLLLGKDNAFRLFCEPTIIPSTEVHIERFIIAKQRYILFSIYILCIVELQVSLSTL